MYQILQCLVVKVCYVAILRFWGVMFMNFNLKNFTIELLIYKGRGTWSKGNTAMYNSKVKVDF